MGDRSGGREPKGASLKKSKKNPGAAAARVKKVAKNGPSTLTSAPALPPGEGNFLDCGVAILSRQFDRDREKVILRGQSEGQCSGMVFWFSDIEKQSNLSDLAKSYPHLCYFVTGIHPDNIDRTNKKSHDGWLEKVEELGRRSECIGILTGINLSREMGTHFAQEALLKSSCSIAEKLGLPLFLYVSDSSSLDRAIETLKEVGWTADSDTAAEATSPRRVILHDLVNSCGGNPDKVDIVIESGFYATVSAAGLTEADEDIRQSAQACVGKFPVSRLLLCSDAPWRTPQNITDSYLRTQRNEPANIPFVFQAVASLFENQYPASELKDMIKANSLSVLGLEYLSNEQLQSATLESSTTEDPSSPETMDASHHSNPSSHSHGNHHLSKAERDLSILKNIESLMEKKDVADSHESENDSSANVSNNSIFYSCQKCRHYLFAEADTFTHGLNAQKTVFKAGDQGLCKSTLFLGCTDSREICQRTGFAIRGTNVECVECGNKLGKYSTNEAPCACGTLVKGPNVRINSSKIDYNDKSLAAEDLALRAKLENEEALLQAQIQAEEEELEEERRLSN